MSDTTVQDAEALILALVVVAYVLRFAVKRLGRSRPDFAIGRQIFVAGGLRFFAVLAVSAAGWQAQLRGGDENTFLFIARAIDTKPFGTSWLPHGPFQLHDVLFALLLKLDFTTLALRVIQIGISLLGIILILGAVYDLAGPRAARIAAWLLAIEPGSVFFNAGIDKEPLMVLAAGLVVFGGTRIWRHLDIPGVLICGLGGLIAVETRSYAGWFLVGACVLILLHTALRRIKTVQTPLRAMPVVYAITVTLFLLTPTLLALTSRQSLQKLQSSQSYTTGVQAATLTGSQNRDNLALEQVDFSSRGAVISNLPQRMFDITFRPYPWQLQNQSQQLGALGSLVALGVLLLLIRYAWRERGRIFTDIAPLLYPIVFLLVAYALSAGNAGTGFRYRTHLVLLSLASVVVLRERWLTRQAEAEATESARVDHPTPLPSRLAPA
jgi:hypothetical protein